MKKRVFALAACLLLVMVTTTQVAIGPVKIYAQIYLQAPAE